VQIHPFSSFLRFFFPEIPEILFLTQTLSIHVFVLLFSID